MEKIKFRLIGKLMMDPTGQTGSGYNDGSRLKYLLNYHLHFYGWFAAILWLQTTWKIKSILLSSHVCWASTASLSSWRKVFHHEPIGILHSEACVQGGGLLPYWSDRIFIRAARLARRDDGLKQEHRSSSSPFLTSVCSQRMWTNERWCCTSCDIPCKRKNNA